nr:lysylphosphatidylglycerol synthase domain-containing protein [Flavobacterium sp.]
MVAIPDKAKQFLFAMVKVLIVAAAFYFIYDRLSHTRLDWKRVQHLLENPMATYLLVGVVILAVLNRFFEILKWRNLVMSIRDISLFEATRQVMASLTAGIFTPNGLGEYAGKALFYEKSWAKKIVFLNLICNGAQMMLTLIFGVFGLLYFNTKQAIIDSQVILFLFIGCCVGFVALLFMKRFSIKGYSLEKLLHKINTLPKNIHLKNMGLAFFRYVFFSHQQYLLLVCFGVKLPYLMVLSTIAISYLLASSLPSFQFFDFAVKGSVAVFFFGQLGVNEWIVIFVTTAIWFLNVVVPVGIGSYFVLRFKPLP